MGQSFRTINCSGISGQGRLAIAVGKTNSLILWSGLNWSLIEMEERAIVRNERSEITQTWELVIYI